MVMDGLRNQFLPGARISAYQYSSGCCGNFFNTREYFFHSGRLPDNIFHLEFAGDFLFKFFIFRFELAMFQDTFYKDA